MAGAAAGVAASTRADDQLAVRAVRVDEMAACQALYVDVMHLAPGDGSINPRLLSALQANGGLVVGAFLGDELLGFTYSFLGRDLRAPAELYQYSQLAVVASAWQGRGVGRRLKYAQRDACLAAGIARMRWAFDPMKTKNGHFNLSVLGARVVDFVPSMYGDVGFGEDATSRNTDRFVVEWALAGPVPVPVPGPVPGPGLDTVQLRDAGAAASVPPSLADAPFATAILDGDDLVIPVPADWARFRAEHEWPEAERLTYAFRTTFTRAIEQGWVGVGCDVVAEGVAAYRFARAADAGVGGDR